MDKEQNNTLNFDSEESTTIILLDDEEKEHEFELVDVMELDDNKYVLLLPLDEEFADSNEAIVMRVDLDEKGEETFSDIENDEEWEKILDAYEKIMSEEQ